MGLVFHPGGILNEGIATISNSTISGNSAKYIGGIDNRGTMIISDSTISENRAYWYGSVSGIYNSGILTISNSTLTRNSAGNIDLAGYPCISNSGILAISHSTISKNYAGGISNSGTATISGSTISENVDRGISNSGSMTIYDSIISGNTGKWSSGGILNWGDLLVGGSTQIVNNTASEYGGGIQSYDGSVTLDGANIVIKFNKAHQPYPLPAGAPWYQQYGIYMTGVPITQNGFNAAIQVTDNTYL